MTIEFEWQSSLSLRSFTKKDEERILAALEDEPGIYVFARRWGAGFEPLYVGQAKKMSSRIKQQFNNRRLIEHIQKAKNGSKVLLVGYLVYNGKTNLQKSLDTAERAFIRYCVAEGHAIHNTKGTKLRVDEVISVGGPSRTAFPKVLGVQD